MRKSFLLTSLTPDSYGYPMTTTISRVSPNPATLMTLGYTFNASRGFPTARSNSAFGWNETFGFDNLDRLTIFNDNDGNHGQAYDGRGRISSNTRLGSYTYSGTSYLPGIDIPIGNNFSIGLSPVLFIGTGGLGVGTNVSANFRSENVDFGLSFGATAWNKHLFTGGNFLETRFGAQMAIGNENVKIGLANSTFGGGGISQTTGSILAYGKNWGLRYENDFQFGLGGDDGDRWRTTGLSLNYKDWTLAMHFATGDPGAPGNRFSDDDIHYTNEPNPYRLGSATLGYRGTFAGWNSESIRHIGQNRFAHDIIQGGQAKHFRMLPNAPYQGFYYGYRRSNIFTTW